MTRKYALAELIAKVEAGFDPEGRPSAFKAFRDPDHAAWALKAYNGSLDAAKPLHDAVHPRWEYAIYSPNDSYGWFEVQLETPEMRASIFEEPISCADKTPARAWLLAILRALHSMEPDI